MERLDERDLQDVLRHVRAARHPVGVAIQRIAVALDQDAEGIAVTGEHAVDDRLIGVERFVGSSRLGAGLWHGASVIPTPRRGQGLRYRRTVRTRFVA